MELEGRTLTIANLHATNNSDIARVEVGLAADFVADAERCILCGDFNVPAYAIQDFSPPIEGIDQILVRGLELERTPSAWPAGAEARERRAPLRPRARRSGGRVDLDAVRAGLPVLDRLAYLNAGTNGPLPRRTVEAMQAIARPRPRSKAAPARSTSRRCSPAATTSVPRSPASSGRRRRPSRSRPRRRRGATSS